ncbi:hypothetical protein ACROYT_G040513 [Oculina patagonica]
MAVRKRRERKLAQENSGQKTTLADLECSDLNSEPVLVNKTKTVRFDIPDSQEQNDQSVTVEMNTVSLIKDNKCFANDNFEFMDGVGTQLNTQSNDMREMQEIFSENEYSLGSAQGETALNQTQTYGFKDNSQQNEYSTDITKESGDVICGHEILEDSMLLTNSTVQHEINLADAVMTPEVQELNFEIAEIEEPGIVLEQCPIEIEDPGQTITVAEEISHVENNFVKGANVSAIRAEIWRQIPPLTKHPPLPTPITQIKAVNGQTIPVVGQVQVPLTIEDKTYPFDVLIIETIAYDVILGRDFLEYFNAKIDFQHRVLELQLDSAFSKAMGTLSKKTMSNLGVTKPSSLLVNGQKHSLTASSH